MANEYVEKFGYRKYKGKIEPRWKRVWSLVRFELMSTWHKSTAGKVLLVIILAINFLLITFGALGIKSVISDRPKYEQAEAIAGILHDMVAGYLSFGRMGERGVSASDIGIQFGMPLGFLIIGLFGIAGSGSFSDDRAGHVMGIYMSKLNRFEYIAGKIGSVILYVNIFLTLPLFLMIGLYIQALGVDHLDYLYLYSGILLYGFLASLLLGLGILCLSSIVDKRMYASLGFYLLFLFGTIFGSIIVTLEESNEFLLLVSPSNFLQLLAYVCMGDTKLFFSTETDQWDTETGDYILAYTPFSLSDGSGLEAFHVLGSTLLLIIVMFIFLMFRLKRLTREALD